MNDDNFYYDPQVVEAREERVRNLKREGELYNSSLEEKIQDCSNQSISELTKIQNTIERTNYTLHDINYKLEKFEKLAGILLWLVIGYGLLLIFPNIAASISPYIKK